MATHHMKRIVTIFCLSAACLLNIALPTALAASKKKLPNCLKSVVIFYAAPEEGSDDQPIPVATGFLIEYKGKIYAATNFNVIPKAAHPIIKTIDAEPLPYSKVLIPDDKRDIVLFEVDKSKFDEERLHPLEPVEDLTEEVGLDGKTFSYGCRSNWETVTSSRGVIEAIGPVNLEVKSTINYNMNGGPILSADTGKVVGVIAVVHAPKKKNSKKTSACLATRIDSIQKLVDFDIREFDSDRDTLKKQMSRIAAIKTRYDRYLARLEEIMAEVKKGYGTKHKLIADFESTYNSDVGKIKALIASGRTGAEKFHLQYFKKQFQTSLESVKEILKKFLSLDKSIDALKEANKKALEKGKFKNSMLDKSKL